MFCKVLTDLAKQTALFIAYEEVDGKENGNGIEQDRGTSSGKVARAYGGRPGEIEGRGVFLGEARERAGLSQKRLAELSGIARNTIMNWEVKGVEHASVGKLSRVARVLGCTIDDLLDDAPAPVAGCGVRKGGWRGR